MGPDEDPAAGENLLGDAAGNAQRRRQPAGEVSAAPHVCRAAPFDSGRKIGMARTGRIGKAAVVGGVLVTVFNDGAQRCAAGMAVFQPGEERGNIALLPGSGQGAFPRTAAVQKGLEFGQVNGLPGRQTVHHHADGPAVGLAEHTHMQQVSKFRGHGSHLPGFDRPPRNPGKTSLPLRPHES